MVEEPIVVVAILALNTVGLMAKVLWDMVRNKRNGNPDGLRATMAMIQKDVQDLESQIQRFSERVDRRDQGMAEKCSMCHQRLASLETRVELLKR